MSMSVDDGINMEESSDHSKSTRKRRSVEEHSTGERWVESEVVSLIHCQVASNVSRFLVVFIYHFILCFFIQQL